MEKRVRREERGRCVRYALSFFTPYLHPGKVGSRIRKWRVEFHSASVLYNVGTYYVTPVAVERGKRGPLWGESGEECETKTWNTDAGTRVTSTEVGEKSSLL